MKNVTKSYHEKWSKITKKTPKAWSIRSNVDKVSLGCFIRQHNLHNSLQSEPRNFILF